MTGLWRRRLRVLRLRIGLAGFFIKELVLSSLKVAEDVLRFRSRARPGIIAVPLDARSDVQIVTFANLVTLTPGTLSLDVSADRRLLYVHAMFIGDLAGDRAGMKRDFESRVMEALP